MTATETKHQNACSIFERIIGKQNQLTMSTIILMLITNESLDATRALKAFNYAIETKIIVLNPLYALAHDFEKMYHLTNSTPF